MIFEDVISGLLNVSSPAKHYEACARAAHIIKAAHGVMRKIQICHGVDDSKLLQRCFEDLRGALYPEHYKTTSLEGEDA
jgi:hypothetical protein